MPLQHRGVEAQRRRRVDDGEQRRLALERCVVDLAGDAGHLQHVAVALGAEAVAVRHLVGEGEHVEGGLEVAHGPVQVDRLDRVAADEVDDVERLAQLEQVAEGVARARARGCRRDRRRSVGCRPTRRRCARRRSSRCAPGSTSAAGTSRGTWRSARGPWPGRSAPGRRQPTRRRRRGAGASRRRGSSCRCRAGSPATHRGSPRARRPRRPRSAGSASSAAGTAAAGGGVSAGPPFDRARRAGSTPSSPALPFPVRPYCICRRVPLVIRVMRRRRPSRGRRRRAPVRRPATGRGARGRARWPGRRCWRGTSR